MPKTNPKPRPYLVKVLHFLAWGLPGLLLALGLNFVLVSHFQIKPSISYIATLCFQTTFNFFICKHIVFKSTNRDHTDRHFLLFSSVNLFMKACDYLLYLFWITYTPSHFLVAQIINITIFSNLKYLVNKKIFTTNR